MKNKIYLIIILLLSCLTSLHSQTDSLFWNSEMIKIATPTSNADWINIKPEISLDPLTFFANQKKALNQGPNDEMRLFKTETDKIGMTHYRYLQYYKGYKINFAEFMLHALDGKLMTANGKMIKGLNKNPVIKLTKEVALQNALRFLPSVQYAWEVPQLENMYKEILHDASATYKPLAELVWVSTDERGDLKNAATYELAFMFDIYPTSLDGKRIYVSASNGRIIQSFPLRANCDATSTVTNFYGSQGFSTRLIPGSSPARWNLWNDCQPAFVRTQKWASNGIYTDYISNASNNWTALQSEATSHWGIERAYNYFLSIHGRNGWNNANGGVFILQDALFPCGTPPPPGPCPNGQNASFGSGTMLVGNADNSNTIDDYNTLDIVAHEFTHGVTSTSFGNLIYSKESGALNESFSDIFGVTCHASIFGLSNNTWKVGFDRKNPNNTAQSLYLRNMSNPNDPVALTPSPDTYLSDPLWVSTTTPTDIGGDNWGVHTNSGVQNFMYYLLTSGGSGTNKNGTAYSLIGIGIAAAREIAYRALTVGYLFSTSNYAQARTAWVHAAVDLYGACSLQAIETGKAWNAVGLPPPVINQTTTYCGTYGGLVFAVTNPNIYSLSPNCTMTISPASLVQFGSAKVIMNPGFRAQNGSHFRAYVSDCRYAAY